MEILQCLHLDCIKLSIIFLHLIGGNFHFFCLLPQCPACLCCHTQLHPLPWMLNQGLWLDVEKQNQCLSDSHLIGSFSLKMSPLPCILQEPRYTILQWSFPTLCQSGCLSLNPQAGWPNFGHCLVKECFSELLLWWFVRYQLGRNIQRIVPLWSSSKRRLWPIHKG